MFYQKTGFVLMLLSVLAVASSAGLEKKEVHFKTAEGLTVVIPECVPYQKDGWKHAVHLNEAGVPTVYYPKDWGVVLNQGVSPGKEGVYWVVFNNKKGTLFLEFQIREFKKGNLKYTVNYKRELPAFRLKAK